MNIEVRKIMGKHHEVKFSNSELGTMDDEEVLEVAAKLITAADEILTNIGNEEAVKACSAVFKAMFDREIAA